MGAWMRHSGQDFGWPSIDRLAISREMLRGEWWPQPALRLDVGPAQDMSAAPDLGVELPVGVGSIAGSPHASRGAHHASARAASE